MKSTVLLFTSPTCPSCPPAKQFLQSLSKERHDFSYTILSTAHPQTQALAKEHDVRAVPTFIIKGPGYKNSIGFVGVPSKGKCNELLDLSLGLDKNVQKTQKTPREYSIGKFKFTF